MNLKTQITIKLWMCILQSSQFKCFLPNEKNEIWGHGTKRKLKIDIEGVAQLAAAADSRSAGWGFESLRPQKLFSSFSFSSVFFFKFLNNKDD